MSNAVVNTNIEALNTHRNLKNVGVSSMKASGRLSSGLKINSAADDAAGLAISEKMRSQIRGLQKAERNVEDGISLVTTMEGGMAEIQGMLNRQRELIIQALNDTNTYDDRMNIQKELDELTDEISAMANRTEFNTIPLLNQTSEDLELYMYSGFTKEDGLTTPDIANTTLLYPLPATKGTTPPGATPTGLVDTFQAGPTGSPTKGIYDFAREHCVPWEEGDSIYFSQTVTVKTNPVENTSAPIIPAPINPPDLLLSDPPNPPETGDWILIDAPPVRYIPQNITITSPIPPHPTGAPTLGGPYTFTLTWSQVDNDQIRCSIFDDFPTDSSPVVNIKGRRNPEEESGDVFFTDLQIEVEITFERTFIYGPDSPFDPNFNNGNNQRAIGEYDGVWQFDFSNPNISYTEPIDFMYRRDINKQDPNNPAVWKFDTFGYDKSTQLVQYYNSEIQDAESELQVTKFIEPKPAIWIQCGANEMQHIDLGRYDCRTCALGLTGMWNEHLVVAQPLDDANISLNLVDAALDKISTYRALCGAQQNRMEFTSKSVAVSAVNLQASESRIRDADMAKEMMNLTRANVLNQAGIAMLTQNARSPERVLALLQQ
jgi:flagellin